MDVFVARQPIFGRSKEVVAYELLYRDSDKNFYNNTLSDSVATSVLLLNSYLNIGMSLLTDDKRGFINFGPNLIMDDIPNLLSKEKIVIELLESVKPDEDLIRKLKELRKQGHIIALDDYVSGYPHTELLDLCHIVKVDFLLNTRQQIRQICKELSAKNKILLAEKVENKEDYDWARQVGFEFFQGYFFAKPSIVRSRKLEGTKFHYFQILEELEQPEPDYGTIASIIELEISLTYKLLKLVNSSFSLINNISSVQHCLSILGIDTFSKWFNLVVLHQLGSNKPKEVVKLGMTRMKFLENLCSQSVYSQHNHSLRLIGILSVIDCLMEKSMDELLASLPVSDTIKDTLLLKPTIYSNFYKMVLHYERGEFSQTKSLSDSINLSFDIFPDIYQDAISWSEDLFHFLSLQEHHLETDTLKNKRKNSLLPIMRYTITESRLY